MCLRILCLSHVLLELTDRLETKSGLCCLRALLSAWLVFVASLSLCSGEILYNARAGQCESACLVFLVACHLPPILRLASFRVLPATFHGPCRRSSSVVQGALRVSCRAALVFSAARRCVFIINSSVSCRFVCMFVCLSSPPLLVRTVEGVVLGVPGLRDLRVGDGVHLCGTTFNMYET